MDLRIRIRIHTKMSWIRNTDPSYSMCYLVFCFSGRPEAAEPERGRVRVAGGHGVSQGTGHHLYGL
jgi:hypothetical protein